ncbi:hypothetical protein VNO78_30464 [Psophocarpus tetragonolobus]|uniref:Uncharacterized protein n=1 Tax=Psophocarpus tetragonolobus TaxID=3891 RepID=A0AAN9X4S3_PSOTE
MEKEVGWTETSDREQAQDASCTGPKSDDALMAEDGLFAGTRAKAQEALSAGPKSRLKRGSEEWAAARNRSPEI